MHEYQITMRIIETAERHAAKNGAVRVKAVNLVVGEYSGCIAESIKMYFDIYSAGTMCENSVINIESVTPMLRCKTCGALFERKPFTFDCVCGGEGNPTEIGREFYIRSIEI